MFSNNREIKHDLSFKSSVFQQKKKAETEGVLLFSTEVKGKNQWRETEYKRNCSFPFFVSLTLFLPSSSVEKKEGRD